MLRTKFSLGLLTIFIFVSSCSQVKPYPQPLPSPSPSGKWVVKLNQSGGIAGVLLSVEISSDGKLTAEDQRSNRIVTQKVSSQNTARLNQLISDAVAASKTVSRSACADCFVYNLEIQSNESDLHIQTDDTTIKDSGAAVLIAYMSKLRDEALGSSH